MGNGVFNESADKIPRKKSTWSDGYFDFEYKNKGYSFEKLVCKNCGGEAFEVLGTGLYETTAKCIKCNMYYIVHTG